MAGRFSSTMSRKSAFAPIVSPGTRVLILGSLPGEASLAAQRYYAHPQNRFWVLAGAVIGREDLGQLAYEERLAALQDAHVGLWDTIASAHRPGSLDAAIREAEPAALRVARGQASGSAGDRLQRCHSGQDRAQGAWTYHAGAD